MQVTESALELLARLGYAPQFGARSLRRVIDQRVEGPLGEMVLRGEISGGDSVLVDVRGDEIEIRKIGTDKI